MIAARILTSPRQNIKSSTNDFVPPHSFHNWISYQPPRSIIMIRCTRLWSTLWLSTAVARPTTSGKARRLCPTTRGWKCYICLSMWQAVVYRCIFGRDSDLEAFSLNPSDGSFAPLADRPGTYTKCLNLRFLSH